MCTCYEPEVVSGFLPTLLLIAASDAGCIRTCPPRLRHDVWRALCASADCTAAHACACIVSATMCGEHCRRHTHVSASSPPPRAESAARVRGKHTYVSPPLRSPPPSCAGGAARFCGRQTQVSAPSPPPSAESATRYCRPHTQVSASSQPQCAESAMRFCWRHMCSPCLYHHRY